MIARVTIIPSAGDTGVLDYAVGAADTGVVRPGVRVLVPLGPRRAVGIVTEIAAASEHPRLKTILAVLDPHPVIDAGLLSLCRWMADYYLSSLGEAVTTALPGNVRVRLERIARLSDPLDAETRAALGDADRQLVDWLAAHGSQAVSVLQKRFGKTLPRTVASLARRGIVLVADELRGGDGTVKVERFHVAARTLAASEAGEWQRRRPAQYELYEYLRQHPLGRARAAELNTTFANAAARLRALRKAGLVGVVEEEIYRSPLPQTVGVDRPVSLTAAQRRAVDAVASSIAAASFRPFLLWGVTGSGKTEVYLRLIDACLRSGRDALVLVPEISLTHQLVDRVRARFGERVAVLHSGASDGERWDEWRRIGRGEVPIVVGARSAIFAPLPRLGLVVVDEEHDAAYKQDDGLRYNARDVAVVRAQKARCPVLLGSATPAVESFQNAAVGRYELLTLPQRVEERPLPSVEIVDLRRVSASGKAVLLSPALLAALQANLAAHGQSLIFLNRRGFSNFLQCMECGDALPCPNCSVNLTLHRRWQALRCHHCDHTIPVPTRCPSCGGSALGSWGAGTEQVEATVGSLVHGARVGRLDRDTTARKGAMQSIFTAWQRREYDILVGTQMVTKGHDVHGVTLVGVLLADQSLNFPDFRAGERTFQLLTQVAGRAGRGTRPGRVIVQTLQPDHAALQCAQRQDYGAFFAHELASRRELGYPPFARLVQLRCEAADAGAAERTAATLAEALRRAAPKGVDVLGPTPSPLERLRGRFRWQVLVRGAAGAAVRATARAGRDAARRATRAADVRVIVDVDPYSLL